MPLAVAGGIVLNSLVVYPDDVTQSLVVAPLFGHAPMLQPTVLGIVDAWAWLAAGAVALVCAGPIGRWWVRTVRRPQADAPSLG